MTQVISALLAIKEIIEVFKEALKLWKKIRERNNFKRNQDAQKEIKRIQESNEYESSADKARALNSAIRKL